MDSAAASGRFAPSRMAASTGRHRSSSVARPVKNSWAEVRSTGEIRTRAASLTHSREASKASY